MPLVQASPDILNLKDDAERFRYIQLALQDIIQQINGNIEIPTNLKANLVNVTFATANDDTSVSHGLGRVPQGYIELDKTEAMSIYRGSGLTNSLVISLRSSAAGRINILFY